MRRTALPYGMNYQTFHGDSRTVLSDGLRTGTLKPNSFDAVICDPPYPGIRRDYGKWTVPEWRQLMGELLALAKQLLKPSGSAVFVLQPSGPKKGTSDPWLHRWIADTADAWEGGGLIQDVIGFNRTCPPCGGATTKGLLRPSVKFCAWFGPGDCYRNQAAIRRPLSKSIQGNRVAIQERRSHHAVNEPRMKATALRNNGTTPFNVIEYTSISGKDDTQANPHPAKTQGAIADWWVKYIVPCGGSVLDPFMGTANIGLACLRQGKTYTGIEVLREHFDTANRRLAAVDKLAG